jgi:hypothetical protein
VYHSAYANKVLSYQFLVSRNDEPVKAIHWTDKQHCGLPSLLFRCFGCKNSFLGDNPTGMWWPFASMWIIDLQYSYRCWFSSWVFTSYGCEQCCSSSVSALEIEADVPPKRRQLCPHPCGVRTQEELSLPLPRTPKINIYVIFAIISALVLFSINIKACLLSVIERSAR